MYPGDSFLEPGTVPGSDAPGAWETVAFRATFVRSNMPAEAAPEAGVDVAAIERQASAARAAWIGSKLKSYYEALMRKFARGAEADRDNYLAAAQSLADLDERIHRYQHMQSRHC
jgi:hypothetical protein